MKKLLVVGEKIVNFIEESEITPGRWLAVFSGIVFGRLSIEYFLSQMKEDLNWIALYDFFNSLMIIYFFSILILKKILSLEIKKIIPVILWGFLLFLLPPFFDYFISKGAGYNSFYILDSLQGIIKRFFTFFGERPDFGITYGIRIEIFLATFFITTYVFLKSRNIFKALLGGFLNYVLLFIFGTFPSWVSIIVDGFEKGFWQVTELDVVGRFVTPFSLFYREINNLKSAMVTKVSLVYIPLLTILVIFFLFLHQKKKLFALFKNIRIPQIAYHSGLLLLGLGAGIIIHQKQPEINFFNFLGLLTVLEAVSFSWIASVIFNDLADKKTDLISNPQRPLIKNIFSEKEYFYIGLVLFSFSIYIAQLVNPKVAFLLIVYQIIAFFYSCPPLRFKKFPFLASFLSALASLFVLFSGFILASPNQSLEKFPFSLMLLLLIGYTLSLPIKDFKDIEGDKAEKIYTVPVIFGEYWGKIIVGSGIFLSFLLSVIFLNETKLFWWSIIFGGLSFWTVVNMNKTKNLQKPLGLEITYQNIFWWMLGIISLYGIILIKIIFFN
jgi:4-hydroxybenzoate polyprenyltransferase